MHPDFEAHLCSMARAIVQVGVNLQPGQPLLITEPYDLQGVHPETGPLVEAVRSVVAAQDGNFDREVERVAPQRAILGKTPWGAGRSTRRAGSEVTVIQSEPSRLRSLVEADNITGFEALVSVHTRRMEQHLTGGGAFLFLLGSQPQLMSGLPAERLARFDRVKWRHLGPVIQRLTRAATQWTLAPAPSAAWADAAFADLPATERLSALWQTVFGSLRVGPALAAVPSNGQGLPTSGSPPPDPIAVWRTHLAGLASRCDELNAARHRSIRYVGPGTDLTLALPRSHVWCTAQRLTKSGVPFVANLPTEEIFSAPHKGSANGTVRVARPVVSGGTVIDGIELEFHRGRVVQALARTGQDALQQLLATDEGAGLIGEVAIVGAALRRDIVDNLSRDKPAPTAPTSSTWQSSGRLFHHTLLDENTAHHIALGDAYRFCSRALVPLAINRSQIHLDLPLDATVSLE